MSKFHIMFVTSNRSKFEQVQQFFAKSDPQLSVEQVSIELPEYQSLDMNYVAQEKAKAAWRVVQRPLLIDDGGVYVECLNNFPGPLSKYVFEGIGFQGLWKLAQDDPRAFIRCCMVYVESAGTQHCFIGETKGRIIAPSPTVHHNPTMPIYSIFVPDGFSKTYAELQGTDEGKKVNYRVNALNSFVQWYRTRT